MRLRFHKHFHKYLHKHSAAWLKFPTAVELRLVAAVVILNLLTGLSVVGAESNTNTNELPPPFVHTARMVFDIIQESDPSTFSCLHYVGRDMRQIWDKRVDDEPLVKAFLFLAQFSDGADIEIAINPEFKSLDSARAEASRYTKALGQLPTVLRRGIKRFSVHKGREGFHAGTGAIVAYAETTDHRLGYDHLEETLFHESVHASWDDLHRLSQDWVNAQKTDGRFLTEYGQSKPEREDLAESALFAYGILHHPGRIPPADTTETVNAIPNRIEFVRALLPPDNPLFFGSREKPACAG